MDVTQFGNAYRHRPVLVTGHTGFKGSWLALWLTELGAAVSGVALAPPTKPSHWEMLGLKLSDHRADIRDFPTLKHIMDMVRPEIVFHLAAQPLVRRSYEEPLETWTSNVAGTANVLEACRQTESVRAIVVVTSDKCYENREWVWGYREVDRLGGHDPYSASKAATELVADSYRKSYFSSDHAALLATARAGNVIGGGDWSEDRLIPDVVRAIATDRPVDIRSPGATRPWQHVLESLSGYLVVGQRLLEGHRDYAEAWNFGPDQNGNRTVTEVLERMRTHWPAVTWQVAEQRKLHEAMLLQLDCTKAHLRLGWRPVWSFERSVSATAEWYRQNLEGRTVVSRQQLQEYVTDAQTLGMIWCRP
jgi:CDP-glucose 4,6-dehydratase